MTMRAVFNGWQNQRKMVFISRGQLVITFPKQGANETALDCVVSRASLGFVWLLARANEVFDGYCGFDALPLFEFTYPIRNGIHHIASGFARSFAGSFRTAWLSVPALGALHNFYFFLRHKFSGKQTPLN